MMTNRLGTIAFALAAALAGCVALGDITVKSGEVLPVGTIGTGPNNKNDGSNIFLEEGATLKGTNSPDYASWTIWRNLYATNGIAYLDGSEMKPDPLITKHAVLSDGLVLRDISTLTLQDNGEPNAPCWYIRHLAGVSFEGRDGAIVLANQGTLVSTPTNPAVSCTLVTAPGGVGKRTIAIAGPNLRLKQVQDDPADFTAQEKTYLFNDGYIPEGHSIAVGKGIFRFCPMTVDFLAQKWVSVEGDGTVTHPIALDGGTLELSAPLNASYAFAGKVSGSGTIKVCRDSASSPTACSFAEIDGCFTFATGASGRTVEVSIGKLGADGMVDDGGCVNLRLSEEDAAKARKITYGDGVIRYVMPNAQGQVAAELLPEQGRRLSDRVVFDGETTIVGMPAVKIGAAEGVRVTANQDGSRVLRAVPGEGTVAVTFKMSEDLPLYWFDASRAYDRTQLGKPCYAAPASANTEGKNYGNVMMTNSFPYVESWYDWRGVTSGRFYLGRYYQGGENVFYPHSYPYLAVGAGPNGLNYLNFGVYNDQPVSGGQPLTQVDHDDTLRSSSSFTSKRRLEFTKDAVPQAVVMVFGSQQGGGIAVFGSGSRHVFKRTGRTLDDAIVATVPSNTSFWLDSVAVADASAQKFNGGWQVLSISGEAVQKITAIGYDESYQDAGGQNYGEIIFFSEPLTDDVRLAYERYLARKWGIATSAGASDGCAVRAEGRGGRLELSPETDAELRGTFGGTVTLKGGTLKISEPLPPTADELPAEGRLCWYDTDDEATIVRDTAVYGGVTYANLARGLLARGRSYADVQEGETYLYGQAERVPYFLRRAPGLATERTWIDFNHPDGYPALGDDGNTMRFSTFGPKRTVTTPAQTGVAQTFRTAFMAIDSSQGGGSPLLSQVMGTGGDFRSRDSSDSSRPLWSAGCSANVRGGVTRVNGVPVDGTAANALTGDAETLTLVAAADVSAAFVDYFSSTQSDTATKAPKRCGLIFGELLLYTAELAAADIARVEAYLQGKWTGTLPDGYSDLRGATVDGTGSVVVADAARLPRFASTFAGDVTAGGDAASFDFAFDADGRLTGAVVAPEATFDLPSPATLTVTAPGAFPAGRYDLFVCKGFAHEMEWNLAVKSAKRRVCGLTTETADGVTRVVLTVEPRGLLLMLK